MPTDFALLPQTDRELLPLLRALPFGFPFFFRRVPCLRSVPRTPCSLVYVVVTSVTLPFYPLHSVTAAAALTTFSAKKCVCVFVCACVYLSLSIYMYTCVYIYIYTYTYTYISIGGEREREREIHTPIVGENVGIRRARHLFRRA